MSDKTEWVMVPREPTSPMVAEAHAVDTGHGSWPRNAYARMIAAAPQPPSGGEPVAYIYKERYGHDDSAWIERIDRTLPAWEHKDVTPLYTAPPSAPVGVEAVADVLQKLRRLALVIREYGTCAPLALDYIGDDLERALAQQPAAGISRADHVRGLADMLTPEKQSDTLRNAIDQQPAADSAAKHWHDLYRAECLRRQDGAARYGQQITNLEAQQPAAVDEAVKRLAYALLMHDQHRTTVQSLASAVGDFLRDYNAAQPGGSDNDR